MNLKIKFTTVTPLCQILGLEERQDGGSKVNITAIQKIPMFVDIGDSKYVAKIPVYTANGFRGKLRREATSLLINKALEKNIDLGKSSLARGRNFHIMNAGSSATFTSIDFETEDEVRKANPLVSLLGTSLAISGKLSVSPLIPKKFSKETKSFEHHVALSDKKRAYSTIVTQNTIYKKDDIIARNRFAAPLGEKVLDEWEQLVAQAKADKKILNVDAGHVQSNEEVMPGVDFYGSIISSQKLTEIEEGLLIASMIKMGERSIGALNATGKGKVDYEIIINEKENSHDGIIRSKWDEYLSESTVTYELSEKSQAALDAFNDWLENITEENIQLEQKLSQFERGKKEEK